MPAVWFAVLSVVMAGAVTVRPPPGAVKVTGIVLLPVSATVGLTMMFAAVPGPVAVLHVTATVAVTVNVVACIELAHIVSANKLPNAAAILFLETDKSIEDLPSLGFAPGLRRERSLTAAVISAFWSNSFRKIAWPLVSGAKNVVYRGARRRKWGYQEGDAVRDTWRVSALRTFEFEGCPIAYRIDGDGPPLFMTQGVGAYGTSPDPLFAILQKHYACLTYDNRGVGASVPAGKRVSVPQMAKDGLALMTHVGWTNAHVIGHSLGGLASLELALTAKSRVRSLTLLNTFANGAEASRMTLKILWILIRLRFGTHAMRKNAFMELVLPPEFKGDEEQAARQLSGILGHDVAEMPESAKAQMTAMKEHSVTHRLPELAGIPTLVITSEKDPIATPGCGRAIAAAIPGARYVEIPGASHSFPVMEPERCAPMIIEHIDRVERTGAA